MGRPIVLVGGEYESWETAEATVHQAAGMVTVQLGVDLTEAYAQLGTYAVSSRRPLRDVAQDVVARRVHLSPAG
jgi:AmiR/NasT family two-component response regulator